ncbi:hypothetical protein BDK51DRAFT_26196 [Blyttiomyces helicus]|uniref:Uncharacterized protein n=1 Tax=Blyttiomyces helicus TaxID=388810 RepID=A0A4P9W5S8_9FUNG|nr:hypothetical protein BDK51DRAFT_26196 [Blyttiomyces helicus]|eukprot:RKO87624.1 hypothetical protein BDK51DRAFT_26196 [Blyttiomyces helicus]
MLTLPRRRFLAPLIAQNAFITSWRPFHLLRTTCIHLSKRAGGNSIANCGITRSFRAVRKCSGRYVLFLPAEEDWGDRAVDGIDWMEGNYPTNGETVEGRIKNKLLVRRAWSKYTALWGQGVKSTFKGIEVGKRCCKSEWSGERVDVAELQGWWLESIAKRTIKEWWMGAPRVANGAKWAPIGAAKSLQPPTDAIIFHRPRITATLVYALCYPESILACAMYEGGGEQNKILGLGK